MDPVARIADAVLYEGYLLWPYRKSAMKNQRRWTFGGVYPQGHSAVHPDDPSVMQTECLVEGGGDCRLEIRVRFLHVVQRDLARISGGDLERVAELAVDEHRHVAWEEATERELVASGLALRDLRCRHERPVQIPGGSSEEELRDSIGVRAGAFLRSWRALSGKVTIAASALGPDLHRVTVRISNDTPFGAGDREEALRQAFCSTHTVLTVQDGAMVSLTDPPDGLRAEAERCENLGTWPVLVGHEGERHTMLSSPIILPDYPEVAAESPGDTFDAAEIDQLLRLSILSLTDEERQEMRAADPKAREILERTESLSQEELMKLHGSIREMTSPPPS
jgi:hydrogenase maturation protease